MNLEELKIKISIDMKDLNKQLKGVTSSIEKTFDTSIKKMAKNTNKEVDKLSKDINKSLTEGFTINSRKFNQELNSTMNQAKRTVKQACTDIRREIQSALNAQGKIRITIESSTSGKMTSGSNSKNGASMASAQYTGAMIIKATNAIIAANNANTNRILVELKGVLVAIGKLNKSLGKEIVIKNEIKQPKAYKVKAPKNSKDETPQSESKSKESALKNLKNDITKQLSPIVESNVSNKNTNALEKGGKVNFTNPGEIINPKQELSIEPYRQIREILEDVNYRVLDFESALTSCNSVAKSVSKSLSTINKSFKGEVIDKNALASNKGIPQKEVIIPAEFKVIDDELQEQINNAVKSIKMPKLNTLGSSIEGDLAHFTEELDTVLSEFGSIDDSYFETTLSSLKDWVKPLEESLEKIRSIRKALDIGEVNIDTTKARSQVDILTDSYEALIDACKTNDINKVRTLFGNDTSPTNSSGRRFPAPRPNKKATDSSNEGKKPPKPTIMGFGFGAYKNELDQLGELAKKVGAKIKKALFDSNDQSLGFLPYQRELNDLSELAQKVANKIKKSFGAISNSLKVKEKEFSNAFKNQFKNLGKDIELEVNFSALEKLKSKIKSLSDTTEKKKIKIDIDAGIEKVKDSINKAKSALNKFVEASKTMWSKITSIFKKGASDAAQATNKLGLSIKDLVKTGLSIGTLYKLIDLGKQSVTTAMQQADAEMRLTASLKQRMGATDKTVEAVRDLIDTQSQLGVLGKDVITMGAQQLAVYTRSKETLESLIPVMNNLLVKQEGIYASAEQAKEMAVRLGEALAEGNLEPLRSADIPITDVEVEAFKHLRTEAEKTEFIVGLVATKVGNINQALAQTPYGAIIQLKNNFKQLLGTLGTLLINVLQPMVQWLNWIVVACNNALKALGKLLGFDMSGGAISLEGLSVGSGEVDTGGIDDAVDSYKDAVEATKDAMKANEEYKGSLMGFDELNILSDNSDSKNSSDEEEMPSGATSGISSSLPEVGELVEGESPFDKFADKMKAFIDEVLEPFKNAWDLLGDRWKTAWAGLIDSFKNFCDKLAEFMVAVWENGKLLLPL